MTEAGPQYSLTTPSNRIFTTASQASPSDQTGSSLESIFGPTFHFSRQKPRQQNMVLIANAFQLSHLQRTRIDCSCVRRRGKIQLSNQFQKSLGNRITEEIKKQGYKSPYDFWIQEACDHFSRATLNFIVAGKTDAKITTIQAFAKLLGVKMADLFDFESP